VGADVPRAGEGANLPHLFEVENLAVGSAHRRFDGDGAHRCGIRRPLALLHGFGQLVRGDRRAAGRQWDEVEAAEQLSAIALVAIEVALLLNQYLAMLAG